jgi:hypothetical protein
MFTYTPTGRVFVFGRSEILFKQTYEVRFNIGTIAYVKKQSEKGILEKVLIKKIHRNAPEIYSGVIPIVSYVDNTNRVWIEEELVDQDDAFDNYHVYWTRIKRMAEELLQYPNK